MNNGTDTTTIEERGAPETVKKTAETQLGAAVEVGPQKTNPNSLQLTASNGSRPFSDPATLHAIQAALNCMK